MSVAFDGFWLLTGSFAVCGLSTNGLINTHLIAYCADHGISEIGGAVAAFGAGTVRTLTGDYLLAFMTSGLACLLASLPVLRITRPAAALAAAG